MSAMSHFLRSLYCASLHSLNFSISLIYNAIVRASMTPAQQVACSMLAVAIATQQVAAIPTHPVCHTHRYDIDHLNKRHTCTVNLLLLKTLDLTVWQQDLAAVNVGLFYATPSTFYACVFEVPPPVPQFVEFSN